MEPSVLLRLEKKQARIVKRCLQELFSKRSLVPITIEKLREIDFLEMLNRRLKIGLEGQEALMSSSALAAYRRVVDIFAEAASSNELCTQSDIATAIREVYEACWQKSQTLENAEELVDLVCTHINSKLGHHTIIAALRGVELQGIQEMRLGKLRLVASVTDLIAAARLDCEDQLEGDSVKRLVGVSCLTTSWTGTFEAAKRWYRQQAYLAAGMLAVEAGVSYEQAASSFCIEPEFEHSSGEAGSIYLFWNDYDKYLGRSISFGRGQNLKLSPEMVAELTKPGTFKYAFDIFQKHEQTILEDAITRAVYWYGDAHRDSVRVMQFVKYWSCLECLLGGTGKELTETLALGVVTVLSFGHYRRLQVPDWEENMRTVKRLYALRSRAVHRASHSHVTFQDVVLLGTWTAWVIYNAVSFSHAGMKEPRTLWEQVQRIASENMSSEMTKNSTV